MKKQITIVIAMLLSLILICTCALAQDSGPGSGQPQGSGQSPGGNPAMNQGDQQFTQNGLGEQMNINVDAIAQAISQLEDEETRDALTALLEAYQTAAAGDSFEDEQAAMQALREALAAAGLQVMNSEPMNFSYNFGREYGRFLDIDKVSEVIATVTDEETAANLTALLGAYRDAVENDDPSAVKDALEALMQGLEGAQLQVDEYTGLQINNALLGCYLDTVAVEAAITALDDPDTVAALIALLDTYMIAANGGDAQAAQEALTALMNALEAAGISI